MLDLQNAVLVCPEDWTGARAEAVRVLREEVAARSGVAWPIRPGPPPAGLPAVVVSAAEPGDGGPAAIRDPAAEGYRIAATTGAGGAARVSLQAEAAPRAALFACGRLLRELDLGPGRVGLPGPLHTSSAPAYRVRGHQLGYRPKNNTYDAWAPAQFERYALDLALFGGNTIELLPPRTDDADRSPLMPLPKDETLRQVSAMLDRYGLCAGLWYPLLEPDYADPATIAAELRAADEVFALCARLDSLFVPGGDPGHTAPAPLLAFMERLAAAARARHPGAEVWVSPQGFRPPALREFFALVRERRPAWLTGVVYGPWTACTLAEMRAALPPGCGVRLYPDIAHTVSCQFPVPEWDLAFMSTLGREPINPRPEAEARIFAGLASGTDGFVTYSEGCNDDCNKFVWTALGWDPAAELGAVVRQYAALLVAPRQAEGAAQALFALERNWRGPLLANAQVPVTLEQVRAIERAATPEERANWRLQSILYRGYYDAHVQRRLIAAAAREEAAWAWLDAAGAVGTEAAIAGALAALGATTAPDPLRARIEELADGLFRGIGMQLSVARHGASAIERGANLDTLDAPLGDGPWLAAALGRIRGLPDASARRAALGALRRAQAPPPGGFLDDLGTPGAQRHLLGGPPDDGDPSWLRSVTSVPTPAARPGAEPLPRLWRTAAETLYGVPLVLRYEHLDPRARYRVRVLYHGRYRAAVRLRAGGDLVHGPLRPSDPPAPVAFPLPAEATRDGTLTLTWELEDGRGIQVAAVWLEPQDGDAGA